MAIFSYNEGSLLERAINSVLQQTYEDIYIYIFDDASTCSKTLDILNKYRSYPKVEVIVRNQNLGIVKNKSLGLLEIQNQLISYLDGDDFYYPKKIECEVETLIKNNADIAFSSFKIVDEKGEIKQWELKNKNYLNSETWLRDIILFNLPYKLGYRYELSKKEIYEKVGYYDTTLDAYEDWDCRIRYNKYCTYAYSEYTGSAYCHSATSISRNIQKRKLVLRSKIKVIHKCLEMEISKNIAFKKILKKHLYNTRIELLKYITPIHRSYKIRTLFDKIFKKTL